MAKLFYYDLETTGVFYWQNGIHQISGAIEIDGKIMEYFDFKVKPYKDAIIDLEALAIGGITAKDLESYEDMASVYRKIIKMLDKYVNRYDKYDKFYLAGFNIAYFDNQFFRQFFLHNKDEYFGAWFWADCHDVMILASAYLQSVRADMRNFKQFNVALQLGIRVDQSKLHDGEYDVMLMIKIYRRVTSGRKYTPYINEDHLLE